MTVASVAYGTDLDDTLVGGFGNDTLYGYAGNDTLNGSIGSDTYVFNLGDGQDTITDYLSGGDVNVIKFGAGIYPDDLSFRKSSNGFHLEIVVGDGGDVVTLQYFYNSTYDPTNPVI
jgi:Ca2+-binding RTX toxin-like protein